MKSHGFTDEQLTALAGRGTERWYSKGAVLISEGDRTDQTFVVLSGSLSVYLADADGKEIVVDSLGAGDVFGEMSLDGEPRSASVIAVERSRLSVLQSRDLREFLADRGDVSYAMILWLIRRARHLTSLVGDLAFLDVYGRIARLLLENASEADGQMVVAGRLTQSEIAKRVNCSRETVSRILNDLVEGRYIELQPRRVVIRRRLPNRW